MLEISQEERFQAKENFSNLLRKDIIKRKLKETYEDALRVANFKIFGANKNSIWMHDKVKFGPHMNFDLPYK